MFAMAVEFNVCGKNLSPPLARASVEPARLVIVQLLQLITSRYAFCRGTSPRYRTSSRRRADVPGAGRSPLVRISRRVRSPRVGAEFLVPGPAVLRPAEDELLDLVELVHPEEAFRVDAVSADSPGTASRGVSVIGKVRLVDDLVHAHEPMDVPMSRSGRGPRRRSCT